MKGKGSFSKSELWPELRRKGSGKNAVEEVSLCPLNKPRVKLWKVRRCRLRCRICFKNRKRVRNKTILRSKAKDRGTRLSSWTLKLKRLKRRRNSRKRPSY